MNTILSTFAVSLAVGYILGFLHRRKFDEWELFWRLKEKNMISRAEALDALFMKQYADPNDALDVSEIINGLPNTITKENLL